jgi:hypothetical protein
MKSFDELQNYKVTKEDEDRMLLSKVRRLKTKLKQKNRFEDKQNNGLYEYDKLKNTKTFKKPKIYEPKNFFQLSPELSKLVDMTEGPFFQVYVVNKNFFIIFTYGKHFRYNLIM